MSVNANRLTQADFFRLCQWCLSKQEMMIENAPNLSEICSIASKDLGFGIISKTLKNAIETCGVKYNPKRTVISRVDSARLQEIIVVQNEHTFELEALEKDASSLRKDLLCYKSDLNSFEMRVKTLQSSFDILLGMVRELSRKSGYVFKDDIFPSNTKTIPVSGKNVKP